MRKASVSDRAAVLALVSHPEALAEVVMIDGPDGPERFGLWVGQRGLIRTILSSPRVLVLKARQLGVTWTLALVALWWALAHPAQTVLIVSIGEREAVDVLRRIRRLYESMPAILREAFPLAQATSTRMEIAHPEGPGVIVSLPSSSTAGRGQTVHLLIGDERPKWPNAAEQEASLLPAAADAGRVVLGGTANGLDGFHDRWQSETWANVFIGALSRPGRTQEMVKAMRDELGDLGPQEFPLTAEEAFLSSGRCAFDLGVLAWYSGNSTEPAKWRASLRRDAANVTAQADDRGDWWVWEWPQPARDYVVVCDPSGGHGSDFTAMSVLDLASWDEVAAYHGKIEPSEVAAQMVMAGYLWRGSRVGMLVPESNGVGQGVVALLREWGYPRLYETEILDQRTKKLGVSYGWTTNEKTRHLAISALQRGLRDRSIGIRDEASIAEMRRFVWVVTNEETGAGRWQAEQGYHDDRVLKWAIAAAVLQHGEALVVRPEPKPLAPYEPRVSSVTGY